MIGVNAHLVISTFTFNIKLFIAINDGFISFVTVLKVSWSSEFEIHSNRLVALWIVMKKGWTIHTHPDSWLYTEVFSERTYIYEMIHKSKRGFFLLVVTRSISLFHLIRGRIHTQLATRNVNLTFLGGWVFACDVSLWH